MGLVEVILLDTHVVIWLLSAPDRLSRAAYEAIREARENAGLAVCSVTLLEIAQLESRGRIQFNGLLSDFLQDVSRQFAVKDITAKIALNSVGFVAPYPRDPVDRVIGATAKTEGIPLVTADEKIRESAQVQTIW